MNVGSAASASQTIFTKARHAHGGHHGAKSTGPAALATPAAAMPILIATSGAPAAPAAPGTGALSFAARLSVTNS